MPTAPVIRCKGLHTGENQLAAVEGGMAEARNVVFPRPDVCEPRRGQKFLGNTAVGVDAYGFGTPADRANELFFFEDTLLVHYGLDKLTRDTGSAFSDYSGSYEPPDAELLRMKFMEMAECLYFTTGAGVKVLETVTGTPARPWVPKALDFYIGATGLSGNPDATGSWMPPDCQVAYRHGFTRKDSHGRWLSGAPSSRFVVKNPADVVVPVGDLSRAGTTVTAAVTEHAFYPGLVVKLAPGEADFAVGNKTITAPFDADSFTYTEAGAAVVSTVEQTFTSGNKVAVATVDLPDGLTTDHFLVIWRSLTSLSQDAEPDDDLYVCYEHKLTAGELVAGSVSFTDTTPELMLGDPMPSSANVGDGPESANERPPLCKDMCEWKGRAFYLNTTGPQRFSVNLLGTGATDGLQTNDTITINGVSYLADATGSTSTSFYLETTLTPALNIERTARFLCHIINTYTGNTTVYAYYVSGSEDAPGRILIEERGLGMAAFSVYASRVSCWSAALTTTSTSAQTSDNSRRPNGFSFSKKGQPEAVPLSNFESAGAKNHQLLRGVPLRDKLFLFAEDGKVHTVSGNGPFNVDELDGTAVLLAPDSVVVAGNLIWALTDQGVVNVSDTGVQVVSFPVEEEIQELFGAPIDELKRYSFGVAYESDRQYQCWMPTEEGDTEAQQGFVRNFFTNTWANWPEARTCGRVRKSNRVLYMGDGNSNQIRVERKSFDRTDYADEALQLNIVSSSGKVVTLNSVSTVQAGDLLYQDDSTKSLVASVDAPNSQVTVRTTETWTVGAVEARVAIDNKVKWTPNAGSQPALTKQFRTAHLHFRRLLAEQPVAYFDTEISPEEKAISLAAARGFGAAWGETPFGGSSTLKNRSAGVPEEHQAATSIRVGFGIREANALWALHGYSLSYEAGSERSSA